MQWHPIFAYLLRVLLEGYYEVQTNVAVGELPREADLLVLRRCTPAPFVGIWRYLAAWNVLEFKGPKVKPRMRDLDLLLEVGLGIDRRLNEERQREHRAIQPRHEMAWWYLANHVGARFRGEVERVLGQPLQKVEPGLWRCPALGRVLWLVSRDVLPIERESIPLHLVSHIPPQREQELARLVAGQEDLRKAYGSWLGFLHPNVWKEVLIMIRDITRKEELDLRPLIEAIGLRHVIDQVGLRQVIDQVGLRQVIDEVGLRQVLDEVGVKQVIEEVGTARLIQDLGFDRLLNEMTPEQREELKRRLS